MVKYSKLEVKGEWSSNSNQPEEVLISFGSISLNILDVSGEPLRQWAYSSIFLKNKETKKSRFCPDIEETENLYIFDCDAIDHLIFLCNKTRQKKFPNLYIWLFIIILLITSSYFFLGYTRTITEKIAASLTSAEQESYLGNVMFGKISEISHCDINKINDYIRSTGEIDPSTMSDDIEVIFINLKEDSGILFPGKKLLVPYSIFEKNDGAFVLGEIIKLASEAIKKKKAIEKFFSKQQNRPLLIYIFGNFTNLNFDKENGLFFSLYRQSKVLDAGFTEKEWLTLKNLCQL